MLLFSLQCGLALNPHQDPHTGPAQVFCLSGKLHFFGWQTKISHIPAKIFVAALAATVI
jgi:hypothetical protein